MRAGFPGLLSALVLCATLAAGGCDGDGGDTTGGPDATGKDIIKPSDADKAKDGRDDEGDAHASRDVRPKDIQQADTEPQPEDTAEPDLGPACLDETGAPCDDDRLCTRDYCDETGACLHERFDDLVEELGGEEGPTFALIDVNPYSETEGETFDLPGRLSDKAVVLVFHSALCQSCQEQGAAARDFYDTLRADAEVVFLSINDAPGAPNLADYVEHEANLEDDIDENDDPTTWPVLQDTAEQNVWRRYCADSNYVVVLGPDGRVAYARTVNFRDPPFVDELAGWIDRALGRP